jgi:type IV pilus assembly protein PilF
MRISLVARAVVATAAVAALAGCVSQSNTQSHPVTESGAPASAHRRAEVHTSLAGEYFSRGNFNVALSETKLAIKDDPNYVQAYNMQGLVYMELREDVAAREAFDRALSLDPNNAEVLNNFGWFLCTRNDTTRAMDMLKRAASDPLYPTREKAYLSTGLCLRRMHQDQEAEQYLRRAVSMRPDMVGALYNLAAITAERKDYKEAQTYIVRYMRLVPEPPLEGLLLGVSIARGLGDSATEQSYLQQLRRRYPDAPQTRELTEKH